MIASVHSHLLWMNESMLKKLLKISINTCLFLSVALSSVIAFGQATYEYNGFYDLSFACKNSTFKNRNKHLCDGRKLPMKSTFISTHPYAY